MTTRNSNDNNKSMRLPLLRASTIVRSSIFFIFFLLLSCGSFTHVVVHANPAFGVDKYTALIVLVAFPDHTDDRLLPDRSYFQNLCETRIIDYLAKQSYGQYVLKGCHVTEWKTTNGTEAFFAGGVANRKSPDQAAAFAVSVLDELDASGTIDWSVYDADGDGALDAVMCTLRYTAVSDANCFSVINESINCSSFDFPYHVRIQHSPPFGLGQ
jgi:hypothetical protein